MFSRIFASFSQARAVLARGGIGCTLAILLIGLLLREFNAAGLSSALRSLTWLT